MSIKSAVIGRFAKRVASRIDRDRRNAVSDQKRILKMLMRHGRKTIYGKDHGFNYIKSYNDFKNQVTVSDYEGLRPYIDQILEGKTDVLWKGRPAYLAKTSGTTSGVKYIPLTKASMPNHMNTARNALLNFAYNNKLISIFDGQMIFVSGSPTLSDTNGIKTGRLSGIVNHEIPSWVKGNQMPSYATNCIDDWEEKLDAIVSETVSKDMRLISGIPPWIQMFYERLLEVTKKATIKEVFPNYSIFAYGGVNFSPYKQALETLVGAQIPSFETYPASEGFIAFQDRNITDGLLLNTNSGIFFEFIPLSEVQNAKPIRLTIEQVELDTDYAIVINNNAGLWGYNLGDTIRFVSKDPYRIIVSGRIKHFISAFGEHVIAKEVEQAMSDISSAMNLPITEFTVAPQVNPTNEELPYHEWLVEFEGGKMELEGLRVQLDNSMRKQNIYYDDLIAGKILQPLVVTPLPKGAFNAYMKSQGKLGGQNKVPRLSNDRKIADALLSLTDPNI